MNPQPAPRDPGEPRARRAARPGELRAFLLALAVHVLLFVMLFVGIRWQTHTAAPVPAELWSTAAPPEAPAPQPPAPEPEPQPVPPPPPPPPPKVAPEPPAPAKPDIALERARKEKERKEQEHKAAEEKKKLELAKKEAEEKRRKELEEKKKQEQARKDAEDKRRKELAQKEAEQKKREQEKREAAQAAAMERQRQQRLSQMVNSAGPPGPRPSQGAPGGAPTGSGAVHGTSDGDYAARIGAVIRSNTVYSIPPDLVGNPKAEFKVTLMPDCSIASVKLTRSSGNPGWDQAARRGIERTDPFPRGPAGCPREIEITRGPRDAQ